MTDLIVTIDGPAASGKSTVACLLAEHLGASFLDTGAMYRAVTLAAMEAGVDLSDEAKLLDVLEGSKFQFASVKGQMTVYINGVDATERIRDPKVTANARHIASTAKLREKLVQMQREFAIRQKKIVTEGRDQGTVAFPDADVKFYLTAGLSERARRREAQLRAKNLLVNIEQIKKILKARDASDQNRDVGPLKPADDAIVVDSTDSSIEEVVGILLNYVKENA